MPAPASDDRPEVRADAVPAPEELTRVVALDGPAGSGKTTVARRSAQALGWRFVDTGATYRAVTLAVLRSGLDPQAAAVDPDVAAAVAEVARAADVTLSTDPAEGWVRLDGEDVSREIRGPEVTGAVSAVSGVRAVRAVLVDLQRRLMGRDGAVVEGRDIATVVAPFAAVKVYLDAEPEERARRRAGEHRTRRADDEASRQASREAVQAALVARDALDNQTNRLEASDGAVHLDTTYLALDEVVAAVLDLAARAGLTASSPA